MLDVGRTWILFTLKASKKAEELSGRYGIVFGFGSLLFVLYRVLNTA